MRSPESNNRINNRINRDPNGVLWQFIESIRPFAEKMRQENTPHVQIKNTIRVQCLLNSELFGPNYEDAQTAAMYFFSLTYENPEESQIIWENLHELSMILRHEINVASNIAILEKVDRLFELNKGGITYFWRLIHSIVRGDIDVKEIAINNEQIYYLDFPDNDKKKENNNDKNRQNLTAAIKEKLAGKLIDKPLPELHESIKFFSDHDRASLRKIIVFLQQDADLLIISSEWKQKIKQYFDEIERYLTDSISKIKLEENRSTARKQRYSEYVNHILEGYLPRLREYCLKMADSNQENLFAADALLEPTLFNTNVLINGAEEPSIAVIVNRWNRLMKDIQMIVGENATRWDMPAFNGPDASKANSDVVETGVDGLDPDEFPAMPSYPSNPKLTAFYHPALSGELKAVTPASIQAQTKESSLTTTKFGQPILDPPAPAAASSEDKLAKMKQEFLDWAEGKEEKVGNEQAVEPKGNSADKDDKNKWQRVIVKKPHLDQTCHGIPTIPGPPDAVKKQTGVDPLGATVAAPKIASIPPKTKTPELKKPSVQMVNGKGISYMDFFDSLSPTELKQAENERKRFINEEFNYLKVKILDGSLDLTNQSETFLLNKMHIEIYKRYVQTDNLRRFFISECCRLFKEINKPIELNPKEKETDAATKEYIYSTLSLLFTQILHQIRISYDIDQYFGENQSGLPNCKTINSYTAIPQLTDYEHLSRTLSENDPVLSEIKNYALKAIKKLENLEYYIEIMVRIAEGDRSTFLELQSYYAGLKQEHEQIQSMIQILKKKFSVGFFKRLFGKKKLQSETNEYFDALAVHIEKIWETGIKPSMQIFGKLTLGQHKKQIQSGIE